MARRATKGDEKPARWGGRPRPASAEPWIRLRVGRPAPPGGVSAECFFRRKYRNNCARHRRRSGKASIGGHRFTPSGARGGRRAKSARHCPHLRAAPPGASLPVKQSRTSFCMQKARYLALQYCLRTETIVSINPRAVKLHAYRHTHDPNISYAPPRRGRYDNGLRRHSVERS